MNPGDFTKPVKAHTRGPLPAWLGLLAAIAEPIYRWEITRRNRAFDAGRGVVSLDRPVISVGNLSVGGTGKSPMVARVVRTLIAMGQAPCIAMRGYGARHGGRSDEEDSYLRQFPGVAVVARADRVEGLLDLFAEEARAHDCAGESGEANASPAITREGPPKVSDVVVLDDGFQHRRVARDLDIVMIDATRNPFEDRLLPRGWLREPAQSLSRAGLVVLTHGDEARNAKLEREVHEIKADLPILRAKHTWEGLLWRDAGSGEDRELPSASLSGRRVMVCCAIGNPDRFIAMVRGAIGADPCEVLTLGDHDAYEPGRIAKLLELARASRADVIIVTDKDWSKLRRVRPEVWPCALARPRLELTLSGEAALETALREAIERHRVSMLAN